MKTPDDPDQQAYGLGKKIVPEVIVSEDKWEPFKGQHGTNMERNKRTGEIRTDQTPKGSQIPDPIQHYLDILKKNDEAYARQLQQQEEDGFPLNEWGVM